MHVRNQLFIGGVWVAPASDAVFEIVCPSTEEVVGRVPSGGSLDMDRAVGAPSMAVNGLGAHRSSEPVCLQRSVDDWATEPTSWRR